jgi:hypothetical protein
MKLDTRWLDWQPSTEKFEKSPGCELTELTEINFVSSVSPAPTQNQNFGPHEADPEAYESGFDRWATSRCVFQDRCWGGIGALHVDYARWCDWEGRDVPASRRTFERILLSQGLWREEDLRDGLIYGLLLRADWEARPESLDALDSPQKKHPPQRLPSLPARPTVMGR